MMHSKPSRLTKSKEIFLNMIGKMKNTIRNCLYHFFEIHFANDLFRTLIGLKGYFIHV